MELPEEDKVEKNERNIHNCSDREETNREKAGKCEKEKYENRVVKF